VAVKAWSLVADPAASAAQVQARERWLLLQAP